MLGTAIVQSTVTMRTAQRISLQTAFGGNLTSSLFFLEFLQKKSSFFSILQQFTLFFFIIIIIIILLLWAKISF